MDRKRLINALSGLLSSALNGKPDAHKMSGMEFYFQGLGGLKLSITETAKLEEAADFLLKHFPRVARRSILAEVQKFCCEFIPELQMEGHAHSIWAKLPKFLDRLDSLQTQSTSVYVQVAGINLKIPEWTFGPATFMRGDHRTIDQDRLQITRSDGTKPEPLDPNIVVVYIKLAGETDFAREHATERIQQILDCIQFLSLPENLGSWKGDIREFRLLCSEPSLPVSSAIWTLSSQGPT